MKAVGMQEKGYFLSLALPLFPILPKQQSGKEKGQWFGKMVPNILVIG